MKAIDIKWDTDGDQEVFDLLPQEVEIPEEIVDLDEDGEYDVDGISDWLSDEFGFCHYGFKLVDWE